MAVSVRVNPVHLRRVLTRLAAAGTVASRPGPNGGWQLDHDPSDIRLGEVWRAVNAGDSVFGRHAPNPDCPVGGRMTAVLDQLDERAATALSIELNRISIADLTTPRAG
jgi:Rrf2 family protein